jgi:uncharacterized membrane protein
MLSLLQWGRLLARLAPLLLSLVMTLVKLLHFLLFLFVAGRSTLRSLRARDSERDGFAPALLSDRLAVAVCERGRLKWFE